MADEHFKSQGTHLFFADNTDPLAPVVVKLECPTGITGLNSGAKTKIPTTCLDELVDETTASGLGQPGTMSVPFILRRAALGQQALFELKESGEVIDWLVGLSDGVSAPTITTGAMIAPVDRTSGHFRAYVEDVALDIATNDVVKGTLTLMRSGKVTMNWKT